MLFQTTESEWNLICSNSAESAKINLNTRYLSQLKVTCRQGDWVRRICVRLCDNKLQEIGGDGITSKTKLQPEVAKAAENHSNITEEPKLQEQSKSEGYIAEKQGKRKGSSTNGSDFQAFPYLPRREGRMPEGAVYSHLFTVFWTRQPVQEKNVSIMQLYVHHAYALCQSLWTNSNVNYPMCLKILIRISLSVKLRKKYFV